MSQRGVAKRKATLQRIWPPGETISRWIFGCQREPVHLFGSQLWHLEMARHGKTEQLVLGSQCSESGWDYTCGTMWHLQKRILPDGVSFASLGRGWRDTDCWGKCWGAVLYPEMPSSSGGVFSWERFNFGKKQDVRISGNWPCYMPSLQGIHYIFFWSQVINRGGWTLLHMATWVHLVRAAVGFTGGESAAGCLNNHEFDFV